MPKFKFRLATLLRLRESTRDERRQQLAQAHEADRRLQIEEEEVAGQLAALYADARRTAGPGEVNVDLLLDAQRFEFVLKAQRQQLARQRELVRGEIERRRQALVEANREVQALEKLRDRLAERHREEENRRDLRRLDEAAQMRALAEEAP